MRNRAEASNLVLAVNIALSAKKVPLHVQLQRMIYNEKGNLSELLGATATSEMLLSAMQEVLLSAARRIDLNIINATGDQKWHRVRFHGVDLEHYSR